MRLLENRVVVVSVFTFIQEGGMLRCQVWVFALKTLLGEIHVGNIFVSCVNVAVVFHFEGRGRMMLSHTNAGQERVVLLVEDNPFHAELVQRSLEEMVRIDTYRFDFS